MPDGAGLFHFIPSALQMLRKIPSSSSSVTRMGGNSNSESLRKKFQRPGFRHKIQMPDLLIFFLADSAPARPVRRGSTQINTKPLNCVSERRAPPLNPPSKGGRKGGQITENFRCSGFEIRNLISQDLQS